MSTTRIGVIIDALVTTLTAALPNVTVVDGPPINAGDGDQLYIGWDGQEGTPAADAQQEWLGLGNRARNESPVILCYAESYKGDETNMKAVRDAVLAIVQQTETSLRTDPTLGGALTQPAWAWFDAVGSLVQQQTAQGVKAAVVFRVAAKARI